MNLLHKCYYHLMRSVNHPRARLSISRFLAKARRGKGIKYDTDLFSSGQQVLGQVLNEQQLRDIHSCISNIECANPYNKNPVYFNPDTVLDTDVNWNGAYDFKKVVNCPHLLALANDSKILELVENFLGAEPVITNLQMWWTFPRSNPTDSQLYHRDRDGWRFVKLFCYLTDVGKNNGPHFFVLDSCHSTKFTKLQRYSDNVIEDAFNREKIVEMTGKAGLCFLEDTQGLHKGTSPSMGRRLLFSVEYSLMPLSPYIVQRIAVPTQFENKLNQKVNRLLFNF